MPTLDPVAPSPPPLDPFFAPRSVAVVGASSDPGKIAGRALSQLLEGGYKGRVFPINPHHDRVQGLPSFPSISAIGEPVDLAIVALPAGHAVDAVAECGELGVRAAIVFAAGFAEVDDAGRELQDRLRAIGERYGIRILGPNCLGLMNLAGGVTATFSTSVERAARDGRHEPGVIGFVSQSGAFGSHCFTAASLRDLAFSCWVTTGNECDVEFADCLEYLAEDPNTEVIMAYLEGCRNGAKLMAALETARRNRKPVVMMKVGTSMVGATAAASHTGSLVGADTAFDTVFARYGVHRARTIDEMLQVAEACAHGRLPADDRLGLVTVSGGVGILMADRAESLGLDVAELPASARDRLRQLWPSAAVRNPVDTTAQVIDRPEMVGQFVTTLLDEGDYGSLIVFLTHVGQDETAVEQMCGPLAAVRERFPDRLIIISLLATPRTRHRLTRDGFLVVEDPSTAVDLVDVLTRLRRRLDARGGRTELAGNTLPAPPPPGRRMSEHEAKELIGRIGVPAPPERVVRSADEAVAAATELGRPVVLKLATARAAHKSDVGGVRLGLRTDDEVTGGFAELSAVADAHWPGAARDGVLVAPMISGGIETIIGFHRDPVFGPVMMFGLGGVHAEVQRDVTFRMPPITPDEAMRMIGEVRGRPILDGHRGGPAVDVRALADAVSALSHLAVAWADDVESVEVNPLLVLPDGQGVAALDALVIGREAAS